MQGPKEGGDERKAGTQAVGNRNSRFKLWNAFKVLSVLPRLLFNFGIFAPKKTALGSFSFKFLHETLCISNPFLTFWPLACGFGSPEVVLFAGAKPLGARVWIVPWLLAVLGLVSPLWQAGRSRQFYNLSSRYDWNRKSAARDCTACILNTLLSNKNEYPIARRDEQGWNHFSVIQAVGKGSPNTHGLFLPPHSLSLLSSPEGVLSHMVSLGGLREWGRVGLRVLSLSPFGFWKTNDHSLAYLFDLGQERQG